MSRTLSFCLGFIQLLERSFLELQKFVNCKKLRSERADSRSKKNYNPAACGTNIHRKIDKMKRQRAMYQMKEQDKTPEKQLNEV